MKKLAMTALVVLLAGCTTTQGTNDPAAMNANKSAMCQKQGGCDKMKGEMAQKDGEEKKPCCKKMCAKPTFND